MKILRFFAEKSKKHLLFFNVHGIILWYIALIVKAAQF